MRVWLLPIEPFEERYTADWLRWWPAGLSAAGFDVRVLLGSAGDGERSSGEFLDATATWEWKGTQVAALARAWREVRDGDVVLSLDGWGPATTAALYMRATTGKRVRVVVFMHAGAFDPHDFLSRSGCAPWALHVERGWVTGADLVLCGSEYAADLMRRHLWPGVRCAVTGVPVMADELSRFRVPWEERGPLVVFPHRLAPEKGLAEWAEIERAYRSLYRDHAAVSFVRSRDAYAQKSDLYALLGRARVVVSCAKQETFGIAMQEGVALGAHAVAPNRLCYPEVMRGSGYLYDSPAVAAVQVRSALFATAPAAWDGYHDRAIARAAAAILEMP